MAFNVRDHSKGDVFVPSGSFPSVEAKPIGPKTPSVTAPGGAIEIVQRGTAYGGVRANDGSILPTRDRMKKYDKSTFKPQMPENA